MHTLLSQCVQVSDVMVIVFINIIHETLLDPVKLSEFQNNYV